MYLFFFAALLIIFQYANEKKIYSSQQEKITVLELKLKKADSSLAVVNNESAPCYFGLKNNEQAYIYFEHSGIDVNGIEQRIEDAVISQNTPQGNTLIPYAPDPDPFMVNKVGVLNHKWAIADFTDGMRWGEMLLNYTIETDGKITFDNLRSMVYPIE